MSIINPNEKYKESYCHLCKKTIKEPIHPAITMLNNNMGSYASLVMGRIDFCWNCFESTAGPGYLTLLLIETTDNETKRIGEDQESIKNLRALIKARQEK